MLQLNPQQQDAVTSIYEPLLVLAGAGSGKTRVIIEKISHLICNCGFNPKKICAVTFTNKAAREMGERIKKKLGKQAQGLMVSTFHILGLKIVRREYRTLGFRPNISIYDTEDCLNLVREITSTETSGVDDNLNAVLQQISSWKSEALLPHEVIPQVQTDKEMLHARIYQQYQQTLQTYNAVDFDDLILLPLKLLQSHPEIKERWQNKIHYMLVDEYQDTNTTQYELIKCLTGVRSALTVVGDDHQSIYAWRGAKPENISALQTDFRNLRVIKLEQNYRSTNTILKAANHLISHNPKSFEKNLWSDLGDGENIKIIVTKNDEDEAQRIAADIMHHMMLYSTKFSDYAIMYRSNHQSRVVEKALREYQIPYQLSGGTSFFARTEIKDILGYLKVLTNPDDDLSFLRIVNTPRREIGPATLEKLSNYARQREIPLYRASFEIGLEQTLTGKPLHKLREFTEWLRAMGDNLERENSIGTIKAMIEAIDYETWLLDTCSNPTVAEKRMENVRELVSWLERMMKNENSEDGEELTFAAAVNKMILIDILSRQEQESEFDQAQLLTLHAAKGLEFPYVYILGMEEDIIPHRNSIDSDTIEEERRLAYVGLTRAKRGLTLTLTKQRRKHGEIIECKPSRFLDELPTDLIAWEGAKQADPEQRKQQGKANFSALKNLLGTCTN